MSILIKGMGMPKSCFECPMRRKVDPDTIKCLATGERFEETFAGTIETRNRGNCPLVPVPPHGRLGDLDEINEKHDKLSRDFCHGYFKSTWDFVCAARKIFYDAPTIIPAEEGE